MVRSWLIALAVAAGLFGYTSASADSLSIIVRSDYAYTVELSFYSRAYNRAWPGGTQVYILDTSEPYTYNLNCHSGEYICYGAWPRGRTSVYWGSGYGGRQGCSSCCFTCGAGQPPVIVLNN
jgi:hypothetical protein